MKVFKTYDDFWNTTPDVKRMALDPNNYYYESIICKTRLDTWFAILYDSDTNTMDIVAEFYSFKEALRWAQAYQMCDYAFGVDNFNEFEELP